MCNMNDHRPMPRVLVVDDNVDAADMLKELLGLFDCEARACYSGREALETGDQFMPDLVLMDIGMPGMDGFETARRMRDTPWGRRTRIAALTAWNDIDTRERITDANMDMHFVKPISKNQLTELIFSLQSSHC